MPGLAFLPTALRMPHKNMSQKVGVFNLEKFENGALGELGVTRWINFSGNCVNSENLFDLIREHPGVFEIFKF
jgi:hypothetical protein